MQLYISMHACVHSLFSPILVLAIENKLTFQLFMFCFFKPVKNTWRRTLRGQATLTSCQSSWLTRPPFSFAFPFFSSPFIQFLPVSETLRHSFGGVWDGKLWMNVTNTAIFDLQSSWLPFSITSSCYEAQKTQTESAEYTV